MSEPRTFRLTLAYDGTCFHGWQRQPGTRTVQGELERALGRVLGGAEVPVAGAGRTDAGVHARGQVASFAAVTTLPARALPPLLARVLPDDMRVLDAAEVPAGFHARHSARARRYVYRLLDRADLLLERHAWWPRRAIAAGALAAAAGPVAGKHDCAAFETAGSSPAEPVCRIAEARWRPWEGGLALEIEADHFLYRMVRNLVGTMVEAAHGLDPAEHVRAVIASRDRARCGPTAPPQGLCLEVVRYAPEAA